MPDQREIVEPLAKFHIRVTSGRRFTLPRETRDLYSIHEGYYVELIVRKIDPKQQRIIGRGLFVPKVSTNGVITIPKALVNQLNIRKGEIVEVLIIDILKPEDLLSEKAKLLKGVLRGKYEILTPEQEIPISHPSKHVQGR